jgi:pyruvate dehydrogenase E1 component alpha subunit
MKRDPIPRFERVVLEGGDLTQPELTSVQKQVDTEIEEAVVFAKNSPFEDPKEAFEDIYA